MFGRKKAADAAQKNSEDVAKKKNPILNTNLALVLLSAVVLLFISYRKEVPHLVQELTHEIGFALLVAATIWTTFEAFLHAETEDHWTNRIEKISKNVFMGVFKRNFPEALISEANLLILEHKFIRRELNVTYTISDEHYQDRNGDQKTFVKLNTVTRYKIKNVSNGPASFPIALALPNPLIDEMKPFCQVKRAILKKDGHDRNFHTEEEWAKSEEKFRAEISDDKKFQVPFCVSNEKLEPGAEAEIIIEYVMAKEEEDTEIFQTLYPTDTLNITVMDRGAAQRIVRARSIHMASLDNDSSAEATGTYNFRLGRYLLPHQGFAIWWKKIPA